MSVISDVHELYGGVRDTWTKSQAHVIAHLVLAGVVFGLCGATIPALPVPRVNPKQISENEWFKLAKDTGLVYVSFVIPVVVVAAYAAMLRAGGQLLVSFITLMFFDSSLSNQYRLVTPSALEPLALTLKKSEFTLGDLFSKSAEVALRYQSKKDSQWEAYQKSVSGLAKNSQVYLGDFLIFLFAWCMLFFVPSQSAWIRANRGCFWPVVLMLSVLAWFAWFRVSRALTALPSLHLIFLSAMIRADPDMSSVLEAPDERKEEVRRRLEELFRGFRQHGDRRPSLMDFLRHRLGVGRTKGEPQAPVRERGILFHSLYERGEGFSWNNELKTRYDEQWLANYFAYLYFRLHQRLAHLARSVWQLARYLITGAP